MQVWDGRNWNWNWNRQQQGALQPAAHLRLLPARSLPILPQPVGLA